MEETSRTFFVLDDHADGTSLPAGSVRLKGWAVGKSGSLITDLRVRVGNRIHPVFHGIPRPDLASYFKTREQFLLGGFEVDLTLAEGENRLEFEYCDIDGEWRAIANRRFVGVGVAAVAQPLPETIGAHVFTRALRVLLRQAANGEIDQEAEAAAAWVPSPHVTRFASLPFHGHLHHPPPIEHAMFGRVNVEGWLFHETSQVRRVAATYDLQVWQFLEYGETLPYVATLFPQFSHASACRIHGWIDVPSQLPNPLSLRIYAELADGSWHLCHVERTHLYGEEVHKAPYAPFSASTFLRAIRSLKRAFLHRGFTVPLDRWFFRGLREVWQEYRIRAPRTDRKAANFSAFPSLPTSPLPRSVALVSHNLNLEGAPLFLLEYARYLAGQNIALKVVSAADGPLRADFERIGASIQVVDVIPILQAADADELKSRLLFLAQQINLQGINLVVANTLSAFWGIHIAKKAKLPSLFYIHESTTPDSFYYGHMSPKTLPLVKATFGDATHVSFLTEATRKYYRTELVRSNHSINPGWIDLAVIDHYRGRNSKKSLRARLGIAESACLVINVGTICDRKGQHIFVRAVDLLWRRTPELARNCEFIMLGGRNTPYDSVIADLVAQVDQPNLRAIRETPEPHQYYGAADLFVCSSYEESFPRVILEAMAFELPVVSTRVHGIPEMVRANNEALLVEPGNSSALATEMARALADRELAAGLARRAREKVEATFDYQKLLPQHVKLAAFIASSDSAK